MALSIFYIVFVIAYFTGLTENLPERHNILELSVKIFSFISGVIACPLNIINYFTDLSLYFNAQHSYIKYIENIKKYMPVTNTTVYSSSADSQPNQVSSLANSKVGASPTFDSVPFSRVDTNTFLNSPFEEN